MRLYPKVYLCEESVGGLFTFRVSLHGGSPSEALGPWYSCMRCNCHHDSDGTLQSGEVKLITTCLSPGLLVCITVEEMNWEMLCALPTGRGV